MRQAVPLLPDGTMGTGPNKNRSPPSLPTAFQACSCRDIFQAFLAAQERVPLRLEACIFGADDFCASLGMKRQPGTDDTAFARRWVALHSRSFGLQPIDQVFVSAAVFSGFRLKEQAP